jgi:LmbE family N-acetylglucosaminyl deacetylase
MQKSLNKVLVVSPHSDDSEYGLGGTIIRHLEEGDEVRVCLVVATSVDFVHKDDSVITGDTRTSEFVDAINIYDKYGHAPASIQCSIWMTDENNDYGFGLESRLDAIPIRDVVNYVEGEIKYFKPNTLYYPSRSHHQDHRVVYEACSTACRPTQPFLPDNIYLYELPTSFWNNNKERYFSPNSYVTIDIEKKAEVVQAHESQIRPRDNKLSFESISDQAKVRGDEVGEKYCEAFELIRSKR